MSALGKSCWQPFRVLGMCRQGLEYWVEGEMGLRDSRAHRQTTRLRNEPAAPAASQGRPGEDRQGTGQQGQRRWAGTYGGFVGACWFVGDVRRTNVPATGHPPALTPPSASASIIMNTYAGPLPDSPVTAASSFSSTVKMRPTAPNSLATRASSSALACGLGVHR